ncbi:DUF2066 domain-containing protein [Sneathiella chungangensis]|uniref:DUF2066 domain-containing protein n=1 Tax=Sneathiella chungangensis TaxID=1418234 RepID=A0A845M6H3_9PROT|nr:DUF2066 domain-containing protein [Sneathiella chungangensis]MZR20833.1 DUF2066 domain-containing protein [Sneathiella chungangensis]
MTETQPTSIFSRIVGLAVLIFCLAGIVAAVPAAENIYVVRDIAVDETAASASDARTIAVRKGQERAINALLRRLVPVPFHNSLPDLDEATITPLVASFQVANERTSAKRYLADLTFEFKRDEIRRLLRVNMLPFSESFGKPVVVLPVFLQEDRAYLWEYPNPWRTVWIDIIDYGLRPQEPDALRDDWAQSLLRPIIVPAGDLSDFKAINAEQAVSLDEAALNALKESYGAAEVQVITASERTEADGTLLLDITQNVAGQLNAAVVQTYKGSANEEELMQSVVFDLVAKIQEDWKRQNVLDFSIENTLAVTTNIKSLADWLAIQQKVEGLSAVTATRVKELSVSQAFWHLTFVGSIDQLTGALAQRDLLLVERDGYWTLDLK